MCLFTKCRRIRTFFRKVTSESTLITSFDNAAVIIGSVFSWADFLSRLFIKIIMQLLEIGLHCFALFWCEEMRKNEQQHSRLEHDTRWQVSLHFYSITKSITRRLTRMILKAAKNRRILRWVGRRGGIASRIIKRTYLCIVLKLL